MKNTDFLAFIAENIQRLKQSSPAFFTVWNKINAIALFLAGIPTIMSWLDISDLNILLPPTWAKVILKIVAFAAAYGLFISKLPVQNNHEVITDGNVILEKPCEDLPFTASRSKTKELKTIKKVNHGKEE